MSEIGYVPVEPTMTSGIGNWSPLAEGTRVYKWTGIGSSDTCTPLRVEKFTDIAVILKAATLSAGDFRLQGAIDPLVNTTDWVVLHEVDGDDEVKITSNTSTIFQVLENPIQIRPANGPSSNLTSGECWIKVSTSARR